MPRTKSSRRSQVLKRRIAERKLLDVNNPPPPPSSFSARRGTGFRHTGRKWQISLVTGWSHKLVLPAESDQKFVLLVGDSQLRSVVDGFVTMPEGLSFGFMVTSGGSASDLRRELESTTLPRPPDAVCLLAPGNNLKTSRTPQEAGLDFELLLLSVCERCPQVVVVDFPPRLNVDSTQQKSFREQFHRVAARLGVRYLSVVEHFPLAWLDLWSRDGVHLSDGVGMKVLVRLLWTASSRLLEEAAAAPQGVRRVSPPASNSRRSERRCTKRRRTSPADQRRRDDEREAL